MLQRNAGSEQSHVLGDLIDGNESKRADHAQNMGPQPPFHPHIPFASARSPWC